MAKADKRAAQRLIDQAVAAGWTYVETKSGCRLLSPDGTSQATWHRSGGSCPHALKNFRSHLRRGWPDGVPGRP